MHLTDWWLALGVDMDNLAPKVKITNSEPWLAARNMIAIGKQIEGNLLGGWGYIAQIRKMSQRLGTSFQNEVVGENMYIPDVYSPDTLLFALVYHKHLLRTESINAGHYLIIKGVAKERKKVLHTAAMLKKRIDDYCSEPKQVEELKQTFAEAIVDPSKDLLEQLSVWIEAEPLARKFVNHIKNATDLIIGQHDLKNEGLDSLFAKIGSLLFGRAAILRQIAANMLLIELLNKGEVLPGDFAQPRQLVAKYPDFASSWLKMDADITDAQKRASATSGVLKSLAAKFAAPNRKQLLIQHAQSNIVALASDLNAGGGSLISDHDFKKMTGIEIVRMAEKTELLQSMLGLKKCLMLYQEQYTRGWAKFSLMDLVKPITEFLSQTFLRYLMSDKVLLVLEAQRLAKQVEALAVSAQDQPETEFNKEAIKKELLTALNGARHNTEAVTRNSMFAFFKEESATAACQLKAIVQKAREFPIFTTPSP